MSMPPAEPSKPKRFSAPLIATVAAIPLALAIGYAARGGVELAASPRPLPEIVQSTPALQHIPVTERPAVMTKGPDVGRINELLNTPYIASVEQAEVLLKRLFPSSKILDAAPLTLNKSSALLEVELLADANNPETRGFVYVLPDGESFLNGPLMDKRSKVAVETKEDVLRQIDEAKAEQEAVRQQASVPQPSSSPPRPGHPSMSIPTAALPAPPQVDMQAAYTKRQAFLDDLSKLPSLVTETGKNPVYVMFDPQCPVCHRLFLQHQDVAKKYDLSFHWIPIHMNEKSWAMSALLLKINNGSRSAGSELLKKIMEKSFVPEAYATTINGMGDADYDLARTSTIRFYEATKENPGIGTPMVVFKAPNGTVEVISGMPLAEDWGVFTSASEDTPHDQGHL